MVLRAGTELITLHAVMIISGMKQTCETHEN